MGTLTQNKMKVTIADKRIHGNTGKVHSIESKLKVSAKMKGKKMPPRTEQWRKKQSEAHKGHKVSIESRKKMSASHQERVSKGLHHMWKGGASSRNTLIRYSLEYRLWRESVFSRDKWTCIWCGQVGGKLNADHIKGFADYPELRFAIDNGRTLCQECHKKTDSYGWKYFHKKHD